MQAEYESVWPNVVRDGKCPKPIAISDLERYKYRFVLQCSGPARTEDAGYQEEIGKLPSEEAVL
jgi:hypothetical protein